MERLFEIMSEAFDTLKSAVENNTTVIASAVVLIKGFADRLEAAGTDPAKLAALTDELRAKDQELAEAVAANTPAAPE